MAGKNFEPDRRKRAAAADQSLSSQPTMEGALEGPAEGGSEFASLSDVLTLRQRARFKIGDLLLGRYKILGELGQGGMGLVFKCLDEVGGVEVALKMLPPEVSHDTGEMEEVRENFQLVSGLIHQNICAIRTLERDANGDYFLIMEYALGSDLRKRRTKNLPSADTRPPSLETLFPLLRQIAAALDYAHSQKVIHRDIKPANVMIAPDGGVKVLDFGLATQVHTSMSRVSHVRYGTSGTGPYMAPEQWKGQYQDARTDQYAFAVLVYELLAGRCPFENPDMAVLREAVIKEQAERPEQISKEVWPVFLRGLAKERDQRFASCTEFVEALGGKKILPQRAQRSQSRKIWLGVAAAVLLLAAYPVYRGCQSSAERRAKETAQAAEAARLDAQKREQAATLQRAAEAALTAGELEKAGAKIAELEQLTGKDGAAVKDLNTKYEAKAGERETNSRYAKASLAREAAQKIDRGEMLGAQLDELELKWREAEAARQGKTWGQALKNYDTVLALAKTATAADVARTAAKEQQTAADAAQQKARQTQAATDAAAEFATAQKEEKAAAMAFGQGDFAGASKAWKKAAELFQGSEKNALAVQAYRAAKDQFEQALAPDADVLKAHGGAKWNAVQEQMRLGAASASDPTVGRQAYATAQAALSAAVTEAKERERQAKLTAALAAARTSRSVQQWDDVMRHAEAALALENGHAEAKRLKAEAEQNLTPSLKLVVEAGGQEVAARIEAGGQSWTAPHSFTLASDKRYVFNVTHAEGKRRWKTEKLELTADWRGPQTRRVKLEEQSYPDLTAAWENSLGMKFEPVPGTKVLFCQWLTRVQDFEAFVQATRHDAMKDMYSLRADGWKQRGDTWKSPGFAQGPTHPVCGVSWDDAKAFCIWLTEKERRAGTIGPQQEYRLPKDWEWSVAVGLSEPKEGAPKDKDGKIADVYPWGREWPPPRGAGNFAGEESKTADTPSNWSVIAGYNDGYPRTSPVGSFKANPYGLFDMSGNLWEWCEDWYDTDQKFRVLRGGSWIFVASGSLLSSDRDYDPPEARRDDYGFRVVLGSSVP